MQAWAIARGCSYKLTKNTTTRITTVCEETCGFKVHAPRYRDTPSFQIKTFRLEHTCPKRNLGHVVNSKYIAAWFLEDIRDDPNWDVGTI